MTAPIYEKPSPLSQGMVIALSIAVVAMAAWLVMTIVTPQEATTAAGRDTDATASVPGAPAMPSAEGTTAPSSQSRSFRPAARSVQFDWPEEFNTAATPPSPQTALPLAPTEFPGTRTTWPAAAAIPDNGRAFAVARQPAAATATNATDAIVDLLAPTPVAGAATAPPPRAAPSRRSPQ